MARGLAPIKREHIRKALPRFAGDVKAQQAEQKRDNGSSKVISEKKSRRKMKKVVNTTVSIGHIKIGFLEISKGNKSAFYFHAPEGARVAAAWSVIIRKSFDSLVVTKSN